MTIKESLEIMNLVQKVEEGSLCWLAHIERREEKHKT